MTALRMPFDLGRLIILTWLAPDRAVANLKNNGTAQHRCSGFIALLRRQELDGRTTETAWWPGIETGDRRQSEKMMANPRYREDATGR